MLARSLGVWLALVVASPVAAQATRELTEAEVIRIAKTMAPEALAALAAIALAQAQETRAGLYPNPDLGLQREHVPGGDVREDSILLTVPIELAGRRPAEQALARSETALARARAARTQSEAVAGALATFYEALAAEASVRIEKRAVARLDEAARVVGRRHEEGATSGYERARIELEAELSRSRLHGTQASARTVRATLAVLLGLEATGLALRGDLTTSEAASTPASERPSIRLLQDAERQARDARSAAGFGWVPALSLTGGLRIAETTGTHYGYVAGLALSLPIFSHGQDLEAEASAREQLAATEALLARRVAHSREQRAREQLVSARQELARFQQTTSARVELLERAAESGYREGDRSTVELLDAQRARTDVDRRTLELELLAKHAEVDLRAARGELE
jgi:cobalt-zinc-cadmium efflux system outer membrane protein